MVYTEYLVELVDLFHRNPSDRMDVHPDGGFEFHRVAAGEYLINITDTSGRVIHVERLNAHPQMTPLNILLRGTQTARTPVGTISLKQLLHPPSRKALQFVVEAQRFSQAGDYAKAAVNLERAVRESPGFSEAHTNLGAQYARLGRSEKALAEFGRAMEISGGNPTIYCNIAATQLRLKRLDQAAQSARAALLMDADFPPGHYILGVVLANDPASKTEAMLHLRRAAGTYPSARAILEDLSRK